MPTETREPDRFEAKAREVVDVVIDCMNGKTDHAGCRTGDGVDHVAAAIRAVEAEALERAARIAENEACAMDEGDQYIKAAHRIADKLRALASPAAAPAAVPMMSGDGQCLGFFAAPPSEPVAPSFVSDLVLDALRRCEDHRTGDAHPPMLCVACAGEAARAARFPTKGKEPRK